MEAGWRDRTVLGQWLQGRLGRYGFVMGCRVFKGKGCSWLFECLCEHLRAAVNRDARGCGRMCSAVEEVFRSFTEEKAAIQEHKTHKYESCYSVYFGTLIQCVLVLLSLLNSSLCPGLATQMWDKSVIFYKFN